MFKDIFNDRKAINNKNMLKNILNKIFGNKNNNILKDLLTNEQINLFMNNIKDVKKILLAAGQDPELAEIYLQYSDGNTRRLEHLISHSISLAKFNGNDKVDGTVIKETSKMLMA